jgi:type IV pilus assembly protein PilB
VTTADDYAVQIALKRGLVSADQLAAAQERAAGHTDLTSPAPDVLDLLATDAVLDQDALGRAVADEFGMPWVVLAERAIPAGILAALPRSFVVEHNVLPYAREGGSLHVAVADPIASRYPRQHRCVEPASANWMVQPAVATGRVIFADAINASSTARMPVDHRRICQTIRSVQPLALASPSRAKPVRRARRATEADAPIINLVHQIIAEAIQRRASDIHLEPLERRFRVRYRIDGVLIEVENPPKRLQLTDHLSPEDHGEHQHRRKTRFRRTGASKSTSAAATRPARVVAAHGARREHRHAYSRQGRLTLGCRSWVSSVTTAATFEQLITLPDGILLVTGPTGSGKTTTLYGCLHFINKPDRKIITVEDPVEYQLNGINQVPVRHDVGMTFASALRAMLRQAPNIVMVGEIRDLETAEIAINASLTGHMVFSPCTPTTRRARSRV